MTPLRNDTNLNTTVAPTTCEFVRGNGNDNAADIRAYQLTSSFDASRHFTALGNLVAIGALTNLASRRPGRFIGFLPSHLERKFVTLFDSSNLYRGENSWLMQVSEAGRSRRWCLVRRSGRTWRGKFVVIALPDRYLSDAARSCDARMDCQASLWLPNSASTNTPLASGVADF